MIAVETIDILQSESEAYPEIPSGMPLSDRREVVQWLEDNLPGFIWNDDFEAEDADAEILEKPADLPVNSSKRRSSADTDLTRYFGEAAKLPLLSAEEEVFYFRRMNFVRWRAEDRLKAINENRPSLRDLRRIIADLEQGDADRNLIAEHNLRLVIPLAHRMHLRTESVWDSISEGNTALLRAIRGFDYGRGFRFSTYATWAIVNSLQRLATKQHRNATRFVPTEGVVFDSVEGDIESATAESMRVTSARERISQLLEALDQRSRSVIAMRYGIGKGAEPMTLKEVGEHFGVSKERVRQIEMKALSSMLAAERQSVLMGA